MDYVIVSCHYDLVRAVWSLQANLIFLTRNILNSVPVDTTLNYVI